MNILGNKSQSEVVHLIYTLELFMILLDFLILNQKLH